MMRALKAVHPEATFEMRNTDFTVSIFVPEDVNTANYSFAQGVYGVLNFRGVLMIDEAEKYATHLMRLIVQARSNKEFLTHGICQTDDGKILEMSITKANMCDVNGRRYPPLNSPAPTKWGEELVQLIMFTARILIIENECKGVAEVTMHGCDDINADEMGEDIQRLDNGLLNLVVVDE